MSDDEIAFESPADQQGFTIFPNVVLLDETLSMPARMTYALLAHYARQDGACFPGQGTLAVKLGVTTRSVHNYLVELDNAMLIRVEQRGVMRSNRYVMLALGLRAKRLAERDRKPVSDHSDRKPVSDMTGSQFPTDVDALTEMQNSEGTRATRLKVSGRPVNAVRWALTEQVLSAYNERAGQKKRLLTSAGQPSEAAKRIYSRVSAYPDLTFEKHDAIIERTLASKWWWRGRESGGPPTIGVVYGPDVFEENITRPGVEVANVTSFRRGQAITPDEQRQVDLMNAVADERARRAAG